LYAEAVKMNQSMNIKHAETPVQYGQTGTTQRPDSEVKLLDLVCDILSNQTILCKSEQHFSNSSALEMMLMKSRIRFYLQTMHEHSGASPSCFVVALEYLERLQKLNPSIELTNLTVQRLLLVAVMVAAKFLEDRTIFNSEW
jgi:hypothetical protein